MVFTCYNLGTSTGEFNLLSYSSLTQKVIYKLLLTCNFSEKPKYQNVVFLIRFVLLKVNVQEFGFVFTKSPIMLKRRLYV